MKPSRSLRPGRTRTALARTAVALVSVLLTVGVASLGADPASAAPSGVEHTSCSTTTQKNHARCLSVWKHAPKQARVGAATARAAAPVKPTEGLGPAEIKAAYQLPNTGGANQTIAIVDAYDNPNAEADLAYFRAAYGLPACTTANKCFKKVDQRGGKKYPEGDPGWGVEIALDVQAASASCPKCKILLVEADDSSFDALGTAVNTAVKLGADVVSNSYGGDESGADAALYKKYYNHPGVAILASSGDYGFGPASSPAVFPHVWAIGGTNLKKTSAGGWKESVWSGAGSGCSAWFAKPSYQKDKNCSMRTVSDISAVADPDTGFAVYDTYGLGVDNGWIVVGGTSLSSPLVAGMIGQAGNADTAWSPSYAYAHPKGLADVVGGSNGYCGGDYLCTGVKGYDAPSGLGSPRGLSAL